MAYKKKEKISLLLYYDYMEQFELLDDKQFRELIYAMIEFDKENKEPELDKITKMAFVPIKRRLKQDKKTWEEMCKNNSENAKKRWNKENATVCDGMRKDTKNTDIDSDKDKDIEKDKDKDKERESNIYSQPHAPTFSEILLFSEELGVDDESYCKKFFNNYESTGWKINGNIIENWKSKFEQWVEDDKEKGKVRMKEKEEDYFDEAGFKIENGRRIL